MNIFSIIALSVLLSLAFVPLAVVGAIGINWLGDKAFDLIADAQELQKRKGWW